MLSRYENFFRFLLARRWPFAALMALLFLVSIVGMGQVKKNSDVRVFFDPKAEITQRLNELESTYGDRENLAFLMVFEDSSALFSSQGLSVVHGITEDAWHLPDVIRVDSLANFQAVNVNEDFIEVDDLVSGEEDLADLDPIRALSLNEPLIYNGLLSTEHDAAVVTLTVNLSSQDGVAANALVQEAEKLIEKYRADLPGLDIRLFGTVALSQAFDEQTTSALGLILPLALVIMILVMRYVLGEWLSSTLVLLLIVSSICGSVGIGALLGFEISPISAYAPIIVMTVAVATCMHYLVSFHNRLALLEKDDAIVEAFASNFFAVFLTNFTTIIGFLSLNMSSSLPFRDLGNFVAIGVASAMLFSTIMLPILLSLVVRKKTGDGARGKSMERTVAWCYRLSTRHYKSLSLVAVVVCSLLASLSLKNQISDNLLSYFSEDTEIGSSIALSKQKLTGLKPIEMSVYSEHGVSDPEYLSHLEALSQWAESQEEVAYTIGLQDTVKRLNRDFNEADPNQYKIPESQELISQYLLFYSSSLPDGLSMSNVMTIDGTHSLFTILVKDLSTKEVLQFKRKLTEWMSVYLPESMQQNPSGLDATFAEMSLENSGNILKSSITVIFIITVILILSFRSFSLGFTSLMTNLFPGLMALGIWAVFDGNMGLSVVIVFAITIGIVVDDTIHFLSRYQQGLRDEGLDVEGALWHAYKKSGVAIVTTSTILAINFMLIASADFLPMHSMGVVSALAIVMALLIDLLFLPSLLLLLNSWSGKRAPSPELKQQVL